MSKFATFRNFIGIGQFISVDLRVELRSVISGRVTGYKSVSTKILSSEIESDNSSSVQRILEAADKLLNDLYGMVWDSDISPDLRTNVCSWIECVSWRVEQENDNAKALAVLLLELQRLNSIQVFDVSDPL